MRKCEVFPEEHSNTQSNNPILQKLLTASSSFVDVALGFIYASGSYKRKLFYSSWLMIGLKTCFSGNQALLLMLLKSLEVMPCLICDLTSIYQFFHAWNWQQYYSNVLLHENIWLSQKFEWSVNYTKNRALEQTFSFYLL